MNSLSFAMQAKLEEGKGPGRAVQGENHRLKKGRARTFYASFVHGATARGHHVVIRFSSLPSSVLNLTQEREEIGAGTGKKVQGL